MVEGYRNQDITPRELDCFICIGFTESNSQIFREGFETIVQGVHQDSSNGCTEWSREDDNREVFINIQSVHRNMQVDARR